MLIIGCDLHTRTQQITLLDTETGELAERRLEHESGEARRFYKELKEPALVGMESTGYALWFAGMLAELGHELVVGDAAKIRAMEPRKQKHDRRDAEHLLKLLVRIDFSRPGKRTDNAHVESFNGTFRQECLNAHWFMTLSIVDPGFWTRQ
jgi:transposase